MPHVATSAERRAPRRTMTPQRLLRAASGWFIALTLFVAFLLNLLPWGRWPGVPDFFGVVLFFWCVHAPRRIGMLLAFVGGILLDVHNARLLGEYALVYTLLVYWAIVLRGRILRFGLAAQTLHVLPVLLIATAVMVGLRSILTLSSPGWWWIFDCVASAALWPILTWLLQLPQRMADGGDPA